MDHHQRGCSNSEDNHLFPSRMAQHLFAKHQLLSLPRLQDAWIGAKETGFPFKFCLVHGWTFASKIVNSGCIEGAVLRALMSGRTEKQNKNLDA
jgi:hypothetical protein